MPLPAQAHGLWPYPVCERLPFDQRGPCLITGDGTRKIATEHADGVLTAAYVAFAAPVYYRQTGAYSFVNVYGPPLTPTITATRRWGDDNLPTVTDTPARATTYTGNGL